MSRGQSSSPGLSWETSEKEWAPNRASSPGLSWAASDKEWAPNGPLSPRSSSSRSGSTEDAPMYASWQMEPTYQPLLSGSGSGGGDTLPGDKNAWLDVPEGTGHLCPKGSRSHTPSCTPLVLSRSASPNVIVSTPLRNDGPAAGAP